MYLVIDAQIKDSIWEMSGDALKQREILLKRNSDKNPNNIFILYVRTKEYPDGYMF